MIGKVQYGPVIPCRQFVTLKSRLETASPPALLSLVSTSYKGCLSISKGYFLTRTPEVPPALLPTGRSDDYISHNEAGPGDLGNPLGAPGSRPGAPSGTVSANHAVSYADPPERTEVGATDLISHRYEAKLGLAVFLFVFFADSGSL